MDASKPADPLVIGLLKQVLPIPDVKTLLESQFEGGAEKRGFAKAFDCCRTLQADRVCGYGTAGGAA